jgi:hypothetical protein
MRLVHLVVAFAMLLGAAGLMLLFYWASEKPPTDQASRLSQEYVRSRVTNEVVKVGHLSDYGHFNFETPTSGTFNVQFEGVEGGGRLRFTRTAEGELGKTHDVYAIGCLKGGAFVSLQADSELLRIIREKGVCPA